MFHSNPHNNQVSPFPGERAVDRAMCLRSLKSWQDRAVDKSEAEAQDLNTNLGPPVSSFANSIAQWYSQGIAESNTVW